MRGGKKIKIDDTVAERLPCIPEENGIFLLGLTALMTIAFFLPDENTGCSLF